MSPLIIRHHIKKLRMLRDDRGDHLEWYLGTFLVSENKNLEFFLYQECFCEVEQERILQQRY